MDVVRKGGAAAAVAAAAARVNLMRKGLVVYLAPERVLCHLVMANKFGFSCFGAREGVIKYY